MKTKIILCLGLVLIGGKLVEKGESPSSAIYAFSRGNLFLVAARPYCLVRG
jgi:hypothetical protein